MGQKQSHSVTPLKDCNSEKAPFTKSDRIIIIGAGPSGVHMGYLLKKLGYEKITILEKSNRIGGKSKTINIDGIPYDMGTKFLSGPCKETIALLEEFKTGNRIKPGHTQDWLSVYFKEKPDVAVDKKEWLLRTVETATDSCTCCCNTVQIVNLISAISRYAKLRKQMFGEHPYYFLPKPSKEVMEMMNMTFQQFLEKHDLLALTPIIEIGFIAQGYPPQVPAYYGLMFITPEVLKDSLRRDDKSGLQVIDTGYQPLWEGIASQSKLDVRFEVDIKSIRRGLGSTEPVRIDAVGPDGSDLHYEADFLMLACNYKHILPVLKDATELEQEIFQSYQMRSYAISIYESPKWKEERPITFWPAKLKEEGRNFADMNVKIILKGKDSVADDSVRRVSSHQLFDKYTPERKDEIKGMLEEDIKSFMGDGAYKIIEQQIWEYFPHFNQEGINKMYPWKIWEMQGKHKTWYLGCCASFETAEHVTTFNRTIVDTLLLGENRSKDMKSEGKESKELEEKGKETELEKEKEEKQENGKEEEKGRAEPKGEKEDQEKGKEQKQENGEQEHEQEKGEEQESGKEEKQENEKEEIQDSSDQ